MSLEDIGRFHLESDVREEFLTDLKTQFNISELMYLSTCNRVEFVFYSSERLYASNFCAQFLSAFWNKKYGDVRSQFPAESWSGVKAVNHLLEVVSSLNSLVVGEREIITQVRTAYEESHKNGLTGDFIRLLMKRTIACGKRVYTETGIATNPVSVVSLAFKAASQYMEGFSGLRVGIIGTGQTNTNFCRFLWKAGVRDFHFYNRTFENAEKAVKLFAGSAYSLHELDEVTQPFDLLVSCTGSELAIVNAENAGKLLTNTSVGVDLAVPSDFDSAITPLLEGRFVDVAVLQAQAGENLAKRKREIVKCEEIIEEEMKLFDVMMQERKIEVSLAEFPSIVKKVKEKAINEVFADQLADLDDDQRTLMLEMANYLEEKFSGLPYKKAKEALLNKPFRD